MKIEFAEMIMKTIIEEKKDVIARRLAVILADDEDTISKLYNGVPVACALNNKNVEELKLQLCSKTEVVTAVHSASYMPNDNQVIFNVDKIICRWFKTEEDASKYRETGEYNWNTCSSCQRDDYEYPAEYEYKNTTSSMSITHKQIKDFVTFEYV